MITMRDVAERAGVSIATVSHVINRTRPVSEELQSRVLDAMGDLGYQPNLLARSLRRGKTFTVGVIVPNSANPFFGEVCRGIGDASFIFSYSLILCNSDGDPARESQHTDVLVEKQVDGILFLSTGVQAGHIQALQKRRIPLVLLEREVAGVEADTVLTDNTLGARLATQHLLELGHRRIACIAGPEERIPSAERVVSFRHALFDAGVPIDEALIIEGDFGYESGYKAAQKFLAMENPPTAIFACNDIMAVAAVCAAEENSHRVPEDVSVVGFDDVRFAAYANPPLTTVAQPAFEMGRLAVHMLIERINGYRLPARCQVLDTELVIRRSCAPPPTRRRGQNPK